MGWFRLFGREGVENEVSPHKPTPGTRQNGVCIAHSNGCSAATTGNDRTGEMQKTGGQFSDISAPRKCTTGESDSSACLKDRSDGNPPDGKLGSTGQEDLLLLEGNHGLMYDEKCRAEFFNQVVNILEKEMLNIMYSGL